MLKAQDIVVLLKLTDSPSDWTFLEIAGELGLSASALHRSLERTHTAGLYDKRRRKVNRDSLLEFLSYGVRYVFPPSLKGEARGVPTAWAAEPLSRKLSSSSRSVPVWPDAEGETRGIALEPIHSIAIEASKRDRGLRELLTLVDAIRIGNARERNLARDNLSERIVGRAAA